MADFVFLLAKAGFHSFVENDIVAVLPEGATPTALEQQLYKVVTATEAETDLSKCQFEREEPLLKCTVCQELIPKDWVPYHEHGELVCRFYLTCSDFTGTFQDGEPYTTDKLNTFGTIRTVNGSVIEVDVALTAEATPYNPIEGEAIIGDTSGAVAFIDDVRPHDVVYEQAHERRWQLDPVTKVLTDRQPASGLSWLSDANKRDHHPYTIHKTVMGEDHPRLGEDPAHDPPP